mgnify:CR=1 FL=1
MIGNVDMVIYKQSLYCKLKVILCNLIIRHLDDLVLDNKAGHPRTANQLVSKCQSPLTNQLKQGVST